MTRNLLQNGNAYNRTLALLEQERTKYQFFASMSKEIQFEYSYHSDVLTMSEWGASRLGIREIIAHPKECEEFTEIFTPEDFQDLLVRLHEARPEDPIISTTYRLNIQGRQRWYKLVARPLWVMEETDELTGIIGKFIDVHEEQMELDHLKQMARYDSLTGLYNRAYACKAVTHALKSGEKFALLLFDLDFFKNANDQFGHLFGDRVLAEVAKKVRESVRSTDIAARIGGDEFLIFMEYTDRIEPLVDRVYEAICGDYQGFEIAASMGVAQAPKDGQKYEQLFHHADQALYAAKQEGRKRYCYYDDSMRGLLSVLSPMDRTADDSEEP